MIFKFFNFIYNCIGSLIPFYEPFANDKLKAFKDLTFHSVNIHLREGTGVRGVKGDCKKVIALLRKRSDKANKLPKSYKILDFSSEQEFVHSFAHNWDQLYEKFLRYKNSGSWYDSTHGFVCINLKNVDLETINLKFPHLDVSIEDVTHALKARMYYQIRNSEKMDTLILKHVNSGFDCEECNSTVYTVSGECLRCGEVNRKHKNIIEKKIYKNYLKAS